MENIAARTQPIPSDALSQLRWRIMSAQSIILLKGNPDDIAKQFRQIRDAGLIVMAFGLVNFIDELSIVLEEVIPSMAELGLRIAERGLLVTLIKSFAY